MPENPATTGVIDVWVMCVLAAAQGLEGCAALDAPKAVAAGRQRLCMLGMGSSPPVNVCSLPHSKHLC